jgi:hypothetical protein
VTSQGSPYGRFQRALTAGQVLQAETAARELGGLNLADALRLVELYAAYEPTKFDRAVVKWLARLLTETNANLLAANIALAALGELRGPNNQARKVLHDLAAAVRPLGPRNANTA